MAFYVVRHSERIDEVDDDTWTAMIENEYAPARASEGKRLRPWRDFANDPVITPRGVQYAHDAAVTMQHIVASRTTGCAGEVTVKVYCSRLRRALQTAYPIAIAFNVPLHYSTGLSQMVALVAKKHGSFQFQSEHEMEAEFPAIPLINCDEPNTAHSLSTVSSVEAIQQILSRCHRSTVNIIVGHRETVRGLAGRLLATPYCCIGVFQQPSAGASTSDQEAAAASAIGSAGPIGCCLPPIRPPAASAVTSSASAASGFSTPPRTTPKTGNKLRGEEIFPLVHVLDRYGEVVDQSIVASGGSKKKKAKK